MECQLEFFLHTKIQRVGGVIFEIIFTLSSCNPCFGTTLFVRFEEREHESLEVIGILHLF